MPGAFPGVGSTGQPIPFMAPGAFVPYHPHSQTGCVPCVTNGPYPVPPSVNECFCSKQRKRESPTSYHYASGCYCAACQARRTAVEMECLKEERRRDREVKDAKEFIRMKNRVDKEAKEAGMEADYRQAKRNYEKWENPEEGRCCSQRDCGQMEGKKQVPFPVYAANPEPVAFLEPLSGSHSRHHYVTQLEAENERLRQDKAHLKGKVARERAIRNREEAARIFLNNKIEGLNLSIQELRKKVNSGENTGGSSKGSTDSKHQTKHGDKGKEKDGAPKKGKAKGNNHHHPHVCYDSDCDSFDSCSNCEFECNVKGCRTCRPKSGRA
ncbi:hypothetical protein ABW19_dt0204012 [Dactylella cylindrospora]|nr:hypothetical protein ABW19_dt0204012 [Dactylella cylindrospora]